MEMVITYLLSIAPMSQELIAHLQSILHCREFCKDEILLKEAQVCDNIYFLVEGLIRIYTKNGKNEFVTWLQYEGAIFIAIISFFNRIPSKEIIQALEKGFAFGITYAQLEETCRLFPEFLVHKAEILRIYHAIQAQRQSDNQSLTHEERYTKLIKSEPQLLQRVIAKHLASYLNMSLPTLNRIKKNQSRARKYASRSIQKCIK